jgi:hypothetical protein
MYESIQGMTHNPIKPTTPSTTTTKPAPLVVRTNIKAGPKFF